MKKDNDMMSQIMERKNKTGAINIDLSSKPLPEWLMQRKGRLPRETSEVKLKEIGGDDSE